MTRSPAGDNLKVCVRNRTYLMTHVMGDSERAREAMAVELAGEYYEILGKYVDASATLGELMVLTEVAKGVYSGRPLTVSEIEKRTGLSRWSVSRIVVRYIENGSLAERKDSDDTRKNRLVWTEEAFKGNRAWSADWLALLEKAGPMLQR